MNESKLWQLRAGLITEGEYQQSMEEIGMGQNPPLPSTKGTANSVAPADVRNLAKAQSTATNVQSRAKLINTPVEFAGAFEDWFKTLGFEPGKVTKGTLRTAIEKSLTKLGYK